MRRRLAQSEPEARQRQSVHVVHGGVTHRVAVKRVGAARRFTLRVRAATYDAVLTMPARASLRTAQAFAERHAEWIDTRLRALPGPIVIAPGTLVPLRGVDHVVVLEQAAPSRPAEVFQPSHPQSPPILKVFAGSSNQVGARLLGYLRREARRDLEASVRKHALALGKTYGRIAVRDTRSRWGSCSSKGTLSFSWRLVMAPAFVLDYLVAHEVAHLAHMNHSAAFWALTRRLAPRMPEAELWLKQHGPMLHRYVMG